MIEEPWIVDPANEPTDAEVEALARATYARLCAEHPTAFANETYERWAADGHSIFQNGRANARFALRRERARPLDTTVYGGAPGIGDVMTVEAWREACEDGMFIDYDGYGSPMKDGKVARMTISPSCRHLVPLDATHIEWYNR